MKQLVVLCLILLSTFYIKAQNNSEKLLALTFPEAYVNIQLNDRQDVINLSKEFILDKVQFDTIRHEYKVRLFLTQQQFSPFIEKGIDFTLEEPERPANTIANNVSDMLKWNCYPSYSTYIALMDTFQKRYPSLCKIDTILANTPDNHAILVAHLTENVDQKNCKPQFLYTSTIHGDEVTGYYCMLRLIDYLLSNYNDNQRVTNILKQIDLWICPVENPDGTYYTNNSSIGPYQSTRTNSRGVDLNRSYPGPFISISEEELEPEISAMIQFVEKHRFILSANFHGGSELANYPWDSWESEEQIHADDLWWQYVAKNYADTNHKHADYGYFTDMYNGVTFGGDWYVIYGSRQDYMNYTQYCREMTIEISATKAPYSGDVDEYWQFNKNSMLNYIEEVQYGFYGSVTDALTGEPISATVFIDQHDMMNSEVHTSTDEINYYRPIKAGTYSVIYSAPGYCTDTIEITTQDGVGKRVDVALRPFPCEVPIDTLETDTTQIDHFAIDMPIQIYPNPSNGKVFLKGEFNKQIIHYQWFDIYGKLICEGTKSMNESFDLTDFPSGIYMLKIQNADKKESIFKLIKQ
ncbi:MAG: T9SS type A sorting domain-containing protein [Bacteroidales bacterium]|nr:T9SS type A sorting domain-containing protein [Bacteroidales bacterium]